MHPYGVKDVEKLLRLPRSTIRALVSAGFVTPERAGRDLRFSFQDLIVLRTAQSLASAKVPPQRITRSLRALRRQLPERMPLSGLSIGAVGDKVVVRDGAGQRQADTGQYLLAFEGDPAAGALSVIERRPVARNDAEAVDWFGRAVAAEKDDPEAAIEAYEQAIAQDGARLDARINLGRLLHETGKLARAEKVYRAAIESGADDALLHYNFAVLLEDRGRGADAIAAYQAALRADPDFADCHYNLALLFEQQKKPREAIRHFSQYRRLVGGAAG